jgi:hypothetical protein
VIVSLALIAGLLAFSDFSKLETTINNLQPAYMVAACVFILAYNAVQLLQWMYLLDQLGTGVPEQEAVLAWAGGNLTKYLPGGSYFQNYLLYETTGIDPAISSVATTLIVLMEPAVALVFLFFFGVDGWRWLRWLIGIGLPLALLFAAGLYFFIESANLPAWITNRALFKRLSDEVIRFRTGLERVAHPAVLLTAAILTGVYVLLEGLALYLVGRGLHLDSLTVSAALAAYYFSIGVALVVPIFTNLGTLEAGGVGAMIALGISRQGAVGTMVIDRGLIIALAIIEALVAGVIFNAPLRRAFRRAP